MWLQDTAGSHQARRMCKEIEPELTDRGAPSGKWWDAEQPPKSPGSSLNHFPVLFSLLYPRWLLHVSVELQNWNANGWGKGFLPSYVWGSFLNGCYNWGFSVINDSSRLGKILVQSIAFLKFLPCLLSQLQGSVDSVTGVYGAGKWFCNYPVSCLVKMITFDQHQCEEQTK